MRTIILKQVHYVIKTNVFKHNSLCLKYLLSSTSSTMKMFLCESTAIEFQLFFIIFHLFIILIRLKVPSFLWYTLFWYSFFHIMHYYIFFSMFLFLFIYLLYILASPSSSPSPSPSSPPLQSFLFCLHQGKGMSLMSINKTWHIKLQ